MVGPGRLHESPLRSGCAAGRSASHRHARTRRHRLSDGGRLPGSRRARAARLHRLCSGRKGQAAVRSAEHRHLRRARRQDEAHRAGAGRQEDRRRGRPVPERAGTGLEPEPGTPRGIPMNNRRRWLALYVLCAGELMIVLDTTIVNVALPSIQESLRFTETALVWVVNAYLLTYAGFLLLGGRLGDLFGHRRLFLYGIALFTAASLACGLSGSQALLVGARAVQGLGGAVVSAIALSLIMDLFTEPGDRAKAMGVYGFVCAGGGSLGVLAGGMLTSAAGWHWVFLVNLPIGIAVYALCRSLIAETGTQAAAGRLDVGGAVTVTTSLMLAVYAIVNGNDAGWRSARTLGLLAAAAVLAAVFLLIESRVRNPLMPLRLFRLRNLSTANVVGALWAAAMFAWFFISALYMQLVLGYSAMQIGLAFLPANLIMAAFSLGLSAKLVMRFGIRLPLAAMNDVAQDESGLASGVVNTAFMMGGALGLAVLASLADARSSSLAASGVDAPAALTAGYHAAFIAATLFAAIAAALSALLLREKRRGPALEGVY